MVDATTNVIIGEETGTINLKTTSTPVTPDAGNVKVFVDSADDATKQVDSTGTVTALGGGLSSPVGISDGGTGQTAKTAAFDALSPVTTRGDTIIRDASNNVRLAVGTAGQHLASDGTDVIWRGASESYSLNESANLTTTSTTFVDVEGTAGKFNLTITTTGGDVMVGFAGSVKNSGVAGILMDVDLDSGTLLGGDDGILTATVGSANHSENLSFVWLEEGLSAASHTFKLQWRVTGGTATMYAGANSGADQDLHPQFWVKEI
jgi:hypothetical protein